MRKLSTRDHLIWQSTVGLGGVIYGLLVIFSQGEQFYVGVSPAEYGENYFYYGTLFLIIGLIFLYTASLNGSIFATFKDSNINIICCQCAKTIKHLDTPQETCIYCGGKLEAIKGFYERHPEFKNEANE